MGVSARDGRRHWCYEPRYDDDLHLLCTVRYVERLELQVTNQKRFSDRIAHQPDVLAGGRFLGARAVTGDLLPAAANGIPNRGPIGDGSRLFGITHIERVHRVRAEKVVRACHGATNVQEAQRAGLCMTNSSRWKIA